MFSMCGLICRFLRGWRQSEAVGLMVHAATLKDASLIVEVAKYSSNTTSQNGENSSLFCQPFCSIQETQHKQLLWRDNNKLAAIVSPKEKVDLVRWTLFLSSSPLSKDVPVDTLTSSFPSSTPITSRKNSICSDCDNVITVLLEASYREKEEESLYGYNVMVEQLAEPYAWKARDVFGVIIHTTPTKLVSMIHAFFNNALIIDDDLSIRKILTVELVGEPSTLRDPSTISDCVSPGPWSHPTHVHTEMEIARAALISPGPEEETSNSNPNLARIGSPFTRGLPLSSSFTSSPFRRPFSAGLSSGCSPIKRGLANQGKSITSPGNDSCPASPLVEEEEELEVKESESDPRPPNVLIYTANNQKYFEDVKKTLLLTFGNHRYVIYQLTDETAFKSPWQSNTRLLVVCGDVPTHVSTVFIRYLLSGGRVLSICSDFLNVAVPLFAFKLPWTAKLVDSGTVEVQEAGVVSMSYSRWKNVQLLHHQHCFHSSPKHKRFSRNLNKEVANTGSAVSVEPTFVEITDEFGMRHRLDLDVLAKDDTWGAPSLLVANVNQGNGKALFSQVHLEKDPNESICFELRGEQLRKCNEARLEILRDLVSAHLGLSVGRLSSAEAQKEAATPRYTPAFVLGKHEARQSFFDAISPFLTDGLLIRPTLTLQFLKEKDAHPSPSETTLPILMTGYPSNFSTVKYFEALETTKLGRLVIYSEVLSSTMDVCRGNPHLGHGVVVIASLQTTGKGRHANAWLSPPGCLMMSFQLHFPLSSAMAQCLPFLQHLVGLATVLGVKGLPGYEGIPLALKWPNDIFLGAESKIGGVVVEAATQASVIVANVGVGVNLWNSAPTTCINDAILEFNEAHATRLPLLQRETLCACVLNQVESLIGVFEAGGADRVIQEYYNHWLHGQMRVTVTNRSGQLETATITGIDQFGFLKASLASGETTVLHPDGNSFNMMEGLIYSKVPAE